MIKYLFACILISPFALAHAPCTTVAEAKSVAEFETQGEAVFTRFVPMNASFGKWEVLVHMEGKRRGWRLFIDRDNSKVLEKHRVANPPSLRAKHQAKSSGPHCGSPRIHLRS